MISSLRSPNVLQALKAEQARRSFLAWLRLVSREMAWDWAHLHYIQGQLDRVTRGEIDRLMLFLPPRHGKSEMVTVRYPVWRMERQRDLRVIVGAYNQTLAEKFSRKSRRIARERFSLNEERQAAEDWETPEGGGLRAVGVGAGITGQGGQLIIIDDPVKSREEANSATYRERVWDWYRDDLYTRLEPGGVMVLIQTRWHEDDLAGRILNSGDAARWTVVSLPAEALENDPLGRAPGEALCPERYDLDALARIKTVLGSSSYWALYQQAPQPAEGGMFKSAWLRRVTDEVPEQFERLVRYWDKAASDGDGDYTVGALLGRRNGDFYVLDVTRGQWSTFQRESVIKETAERDATQYGNVAIWIEQEPGSGGVDSAQATIRNLAGFSVRAERPSGDKATRAEPLAAQLEAGNVTLKRGVWNNAYIDELCSFPNGRHDDQVDASSGAFNKLARNILKARSFQG